MSLDLETVPETAVQGYLLEAAASPLTLSLQDFVSEFGDELLDSLNRANPPVYTGQVRVHRQLILAALKRKLFQVEFLSTLGNQALVVLVYHRPLDAAWEDAARELSLVLDAQLIGRSRG